MYFSGNLEENENLEGHVNKMPNRNENSFTLYQQKNTQTKSRIRSEIECES